MLQFYDVTLLFCPTTDGVPIYNNIIYDILFYTRWLEICTKPYRTATCTYNTDLYVIL